MGPSNVASDLNRGRRIGKYEILTRLSIGGMAELFLAYTAGPGGFKKFVALKQILPDIKADEQFVKMFLDEARITAAFNHANIGQVFDLGEENGELYLAMEFISGQNLEQVIKRTAKREQQLPVGFAARVVHDTCLALHYAHHFTEPSGRPAPVVHRDISPKNVMVTYSGDVKVIDFGIAKAKGRLGRTQVGIVKGTSGYMSPEQVRNEQLDGRSDLFCTATMLHELLVGQRLFNEPNDVQMMLKIAEGEVPPPHQLNPKVPRALSDAVMKGLAKKRDQRFATGKEFARAIAQACPEMFEEEATAEVMTELFEDKIATTRSLLELANAEDTRAMTRAVEELKSETDEPVRDAKGRATPAPRAGLATPRKGRAHSRKDLPTVPGDETAPPRGRARSSPPREPDPPPDLDATMPPTPRRPSGAGRYKSEVARDYGAYSEADVSTERSGERQAIPRREEVPTQPGASDRGRARAETGTAPAGRGGGRSVLGPLLAAGFVLLLGGLGWALWLGPLKDTGPGVALRQLAEGGGDADAPPDTSVKPLDVGPAKGPKPQWVIEKEQQEAQRRAEEERQKAIEAAANDPETQAALKDIQEQIDKLNSQEDELRALKAAAKAGQVQGAANAEKISSLEKQIEDLKKAIAEKQDKAKKKGQGGVEVVKSQKDAKRADVGYLNLRTINPSSCKVYLGDTLLGSTPLKAVPLDSGTHLLRVVDADSKDRTLSVKITPGKTEELNVSVSTLQLAK